MKEEEPIRRVLSATEKRAARRARVLQGSESRLKLVKGEIPTLKAPSDELDAMSLETQLDNDVDELVADTLDSKALPQKKEIEILKRVDTVQRRRDAADRRRRKEILVQEMLDDKKEDVTALKTPQETTELHRQEILPASGSTLGVTEATVSRHSTALKLHLLGEKLVLLLIVAAAFYAALCMDLSSITASLVAKDQLFVGYQDLIAKGVPLDFIRQHFEREQVLPEMREKLELLLTQQLEMEAVGASVTTNEAGWLPGMSDLGYIFTSLVAHPPVVLCVFFVRLLVSTGVKFIQKALDLPDVKNPQEGDLGFLVNLALSSHPVLKDFLVRGRKSLDDVFVFIFVLVVLVAVRAILTQLGSVD
ncbi:unnamed protein product [Peronospora belbahrii]|uniref:Transmembrane protein n=1 Tax=Peronospora belbahrii TaxID=622444 RepID=A0AAU9KNW2_9STRA|nr:unnamed protein product [Peronospora belbahrii]